MAADFHLLAEARKETERFLNSKGITCAGKSNEIVLKMYFNTQHKLIQSKKREIIKAHGLEQKITTIGVGTVIEEILRRASNGDDINPYLSKGALKPSKNDFVLNDWKLHHLHLNNSKDQPSDYFHSRA